MVGKDKKVSNLFNVYKVIILILTLPVSTIDKSFSIINIVKIRLRKQDEK